METREFDNLVEQRDLQLASLLDPRLKHHAFVPNSREEAHAKEALVVEASRTISVQGSTIEDNADDSEDKIFGNLERRKKSARNTAPIDEAKAEVDRYLIEVPISFTITIKNNENELVEIRNDPLIWWGKNQHSYPRLYKLAMRYLLLIMNSVPCERLFSKMGLTVSNQRCSLNPKKVEMIVTVASHVELLDEI